MTALPIDAHRREFGMAKWRRRSQLIHRMRIALPVAMGLIVAALAGWVVVNAVLGAVDEVRQAGASIHMTNPRFLGRDEQGRSYVLSAQQATRDDRDLKRIVLDHPLLTFDLDSPKPTRMSALSGVYREDTKILRLAGDVVMQTSGEVFKTQQSIIDTKAGSISGTRGVEGSGATGSISAKSYEVLDKGQRVFFRGDVHSRLKRD